MAQKSFFNRVASGIKSAWKRDIIPSAGTTSIMTVNEFLERLVGAQDAILVNREQALHIPVFHACVDLIASTMAQLPLHLYKKTGNKTELATDHKFYKTLNLQPNEYQTSYDFRYSMFFNLLVFGNAYALIKYDAKGLPYLYPIETPRVRIRVKNIIGTGVSSYFYQINRTFSSTIEMEATTDEMIHLKWSVNGPLEAADSFYRIRETASLAMSLRRFGLQFFKNAMNPNIAIVFPNGLGDGGLANVKKDLKDRYSSVRNTGEPLVMEEGASIQKLEMDLLHAQYELLITSTNKEITRYFRIPPHMVGIMDSATFSNIEAQAIEFVKHCILHWCVRFEQELAIKLLQPWEQDSYYFKHNIDSLLRGDTLSRTQAQVLQVNNGIKTINEVRADEDMNPLDGGDKALRQMNLQGLNEKPLTNVTKITDPEIK